MILPTDAQRRPVFVLDPLGRMCCKCQSVPAQNCWILCYLFFGAPAFNCFLCNLLKALPPPPADSKEMGQFDFVVFSFYLLDFSRSCNVKNAPRNGALTVVAFASSQQVQRVVEKDPRWNGTERFVMKRGVHTMTCIPKGYVPRDEDSCDSVASTASLGSVWAKSEDFEKDIEDILDKKELC